MIDVSSDRTRISLPALLGYLLAAAVLVALSVGIVILGRHWLFGPAPSLVEGRPFPLEAWVAYVAVALAVLAAYLLQARFVERRPCRELSPQHLDELLLAAAAGVGLTLLVVLMLWLAGSYHILGWRGPADLLAPSLMAIGASLMEEILIRGFVLGLVQRWGGSVVALGVTAVLFGGLHFDNAGGGAWPVVALMLGPGFALGAAALATGRLWLSIGLHFGWNFGQSGLFGLLDSGTSFSSVIDASVTGPYWLTGGAFGPEASLPVLTAWILLGLFYFDRARRLGRLVPFRPATSPG